jgi:hypothetical protein
VSQHESVQDVFAGTQETVKIEMEDEDQNNLVIEPMNTLTQKQVNEVLENYQIKYGLNHSKPVVTLLPQGENVQSTNNITNSNHCQASRVEETTRYPLQKLNRILPKLN